MDHLFSIKDLNLMKAFQLFVHAITIVAFFYAAGYFSKRASLKVSVILIPTSHRFYMDTVPEFYKRNNIVLPQLFYEDEMLKKMIPEGTDDMDEYINIADGTSDLDVIKAIKRGQKTGLIGRRIELLEPHMKKLRYYKHIYDGTDFRGFHPYEQVDALLKYTKGKLTCEEYYTFLCAVIFSREVSHNIYIENTGDVDLKEINLTIPAPLSKVTESRDGNILNFEEIPRTLLSYIQESSNAITLSLPRLKRKEHFTLQVTTRENQIEEGDILRSFSSDRAINKVALILLPIVVFLAMIVLMVLDKFVF